MNAILLIILDFISDFNAPHAKIAIMNTSDLCTREISKT